MNGLALERVSVVFGGLAALPELSLSVGPGEAVGLIGPNGSGKTTAVEVATGGQRPGAGHVRVDGRDLTGRGRAAFARAGIGRTFQGLRLFEGMTAGENVMIGAGRDVGAARAALDEVGLAALWHRPVVALSHGQRRRVEVARALAGSPRYLVLDEPAAGLDPDARATLAEILQRRLARGAGVLVVEHDGDLVAQVCSRLVRLG